MLLTEEKQIMERWEKHYEQSRAAKVSRVETSTMQQKRITQNLEVEEAIRKLKIEKIRDTTR